MYIENGRTQKRPIWTRPEICSHELCASFSSYFVFCKSKTSGISEIRAQRNTRTTPKIRLKSICPNDVVRHHASHCPPNSHHAHHANKKRTARNGQTRQARKNPHTTPHTHTLQIFNAAQTHWLGQSIWFLLFGIATKKKNRPLTRRAAFARFNIFPFINRQPTERDRIKMQSV